MPISEALLMATYANLTHIPLHQQCDHAKSTLYQRWKNLLHKTSLPDLLRTSLSARNQPTPNDLASRANLVMPAQSPCGHYPEVVRHVQMCREPVF